MSIVILCDFDLVTDTTSNELQGVLLRPEEYNYYVLRESARKKYKFTREQEYVTVSCPMYINGYDAYKEGQ